MHCITRKGRCNANDCFGTLKITFYDFFIVIYFSDIKNTIERST